MLVEFTRWVAIEEDYVACVSCVKKLDLLQVLREMTDIAMITHILSRYEYTSIYSSAGRVGYVVLGCLD